MKVAILGSGPAGMFAAHAVYTFGVRDIVIVSNTPKPSVLRGAQYLHKAIPGLTEDWPDGHVEYKKIGSHEGYSKRVYGRVVPEISWNFYEPGLHQTWNLRRAYRKAYRLYEHYLDVEKLNYTDVAPLSQNFDLVINTVPLTVFQVPGDDCGFESQEVWITSWTEHYPVGGRDVIVYNGLDPELVTNPWYRFSRLYGWCAEEYGRAQDAPDNAVCVRKPLAVANSPVPPDWLCVGRYGAWRKRALTHDAYYDVRNYLEEHA